MDADGDADRELLLMCSKIMVFVSKWTCFEELLAPSGDVFVLGGPEHFRGI